MDKRTLGYLERVWVAEINGHLPCQLHPNTMKRLAEKGLVELTERRERMSLGTITIKGWLEAPNEDAATERAATLEGLWDSANRTPKFRYGTDRISSEVEEEEKE